MPELDEELETSGNGHGGDESQELLNSLGIKLSELTRKDGSLVSFSKPELSLLQKILSTGTEEFKEQAFWRMCSFLDQEEALDHIAAFQEAKDLGMDTNFNVAYAFALCSANRKGNFANNLLAMLSETLQHGKWANTPMRKGSDGNRSPRSPLAQQY
jgi:hypothetical protein